MRYVWYVVSAGRHVFCEFGAKPVSLQAVEMSTALCIATTTVFKNVVRFSHSSIVLLIGASLINWFVNWQIINEVSMVLKKIVCHQFSLCVRLFCFVIILQND